MDNFYLNTSFTRLAFLGVHVTPAVKQTLVQRAHERGLSVSLVVCELLSRMLVARGYPRVKGDHA